MNLNFDKNCHSAKRNTEMLRTVYMNWLAAEKIGATNVNLQLFCDQMDFSFQNVSDAFNYLARIK